MHIVGEETKDGMDVLVWATQHLHQKGEEVVLRVTEGGPWKSIAVGNTSWPMLTALGGRVSQDGYEVEGQREGALLHHLWEGGWSGQGVVESRRELKSKIGE